MYGNHFSSQVFYVSVFQEFKTSKHRIYSNFFSEKQTRIKKNITFCRDLLRTNGGMLITV